MKLFGLIPLFSVMTMSVPSRKSSVAPTQSKAPSTRFRNGKRAVHNCTVGTDLLNQQRRFMCTKNGERFAVTGPSARSASATGGYMTVEDAYGERRFSVQVLEGEGGGGAVCHIKLLDVRKALTYKLHWECARGGFGRRTLVVSQEVAPGHEMPVVYMSAGWLRPSVTMRLVQGDTKVAQSLRRRSARETNLRADSRRLCHVRHVDIYTDFDSPTVALMMICFEEFGSPSF